MEKFSVNIRFPKDKSSSIVTVTGLEENVEDAKDYLLLTAEEHVSKILIYHPLVDHCSNIHSF